MANINELITLGIGTPADIPHFILVGLSPESITPPSTGDTNNALTGVSAFSAGGDEEDGELMSIVGELQGGFIAYSDIKVASKLDAGAATAAVVTVTATTDGRLVAHKATWSYSGDPTGGKLTITGGAVAFEVDITKGGPGGLSLGPYVCSLSTNLVATLASGGGAVVGKLNIDYNLRMQQ